MEDNLIAVKNAIADLINAMANLTDEEYILFLRMAESNDFNNASLEGLSRDLKYNTQTTIR